MSDPTPTGAAPDAGSAPPTEAELDAIEALAEAASRGPWECSDVYVSGPIYLVASPGVRLVPREQNEADAAFIAASRQAVPQLVAEVRRLRQESPARTTLADAAEALRRSWEALCRCTDEFMPEYPGACDEREQALYAAVERVIAAHAAAVAARRGE